MRNRCFSALLLAVWLCFIPALALAQNPHQLNIDDTGKVVPEHQQHHAATGDKITWVRITGKKKTWYVLFTGDSPCAEGKEFRAGRQTSCTVNVVCDKAGDQGCKSYHYQSATARQAKLNDPEIVIEPHGN